MAKKTPAAPAPAKDCRPVLAPDNLPFQMHLLVQQMGRRMHTVLERHNLTRLHWGVLCCLWTQDHLATSQIAERLEQLGGTITVALDAMERRGLIGRKADDTDKRIYRVSLSPRGRALKDKLMPEVTGLVKEIFSELNESEYRNLERTVAALRRHLSISLEKQTEAET